MEKWHTKEDRCPPAQSGKFPNQGKENESAFCSIVVVVVGGFFLACEDSGRMFDRSFSACAFFFSKVEISSHTVNPLFGQNQYTVAQRAETTVT